jgi:hypothetical protein
MKRLCVFIIMLLLSVFCFAQQIVGIKVIGRIPDATDNRLYQIQVGSFRLLPNASNAFNKLRSASLNASYEKYGDLTRVLIKGVSAWAVRPCIDLIKRAGFSEVFIKLDLDNETAAAPPPAGQQSSTSRQPSASSHESQSVWTQDDEYEYEDDFSRTGLWKLTGSDPSGTEWKADIVIRNVRNNNFDGYFDWYIGPDFDYRGKEHFTGRFDKEIEKIYFQGTRLENSKNLVLGKYEAYVSPNRDEFYNGWWEESGEFHFSQWQATKEE